MKTTHRYSGARHNSDLFRVLVRAITGTSQPCRGVVDASTGSITFYGKAGPPKILPPDPCGLGCRGRKCMGNG